MIVKIHQNKQWEYALKKEAAEITEHMHAFIDNGYIQYSYYSNN